jgi:uncharacterized membrane protein
MMSPGTSSKRRPPKFVRVMRARPRLFLSMLFGLLLLAVLPRQWEVTARLLIAWDAALVIYLIAAYHLIMQADVRHIRQRAAQQDEGQIAILFLTVLAVLAILAAIIIELGTRAGRSPIQVALAVVTVTLSWGFIHTIFALHYAHEYHDERRAGAGGLNFPGDEEPDYWDFVYFSFVVGMTSQVSDVAVTSKAIRQTVIAHGIVAFIFNTTLLALTVNIAASVI